jgi:HSP20 family protein
MSKNLPIRTSNSIFDELRKTQDRIMKRAYDIFRSNGDSGSDLDNWLAAERELIWKPSIELREADGQFLVNVEMPGVDAEKLNIEVTPDELLVTADIRDERKDEKGKVHTTELKTGHMFRSVSFPKHVIMEKVTAELKDGMLKITAPISDVQKARKVDVHAA